MSCRGVQSPTHLYLVSERCNSCLPENCHVSLVMGGLYHIASLKSSLSSLSSFLKKSSSLFSANVFCKRPIVTNNIAASLQYIAINTVCRCRCVYIIAKQHPPYI